MKAYDGERWEVRHGEHQAIIFTMGMISALEDAFPQIEKRAKICKAWSPLKRACGLMEAALRQVLRTVPDKRLRMIQTNLNNSRMRIDVIRKATDPPGYTYVPNEDYSIVLGTAVQAMCTICDGERCTQQHCKLKTALDHTVTADLADRRDGMCRYWNFGAVADD